METENPTPRLLASGLRGRGGGWYPTARKWLAVKAEEGESFVVGNGAEGEPGSIKDRHVMRTRPERVIEGLLLAAHAVGAREGVICVRGSFETEAAALESCLPADDGVSVRIVRGEEGYIAGEETALLEALEGRRPWPRPKPPLPYAVGYRGRPTLVQNVETLSRVSDAVRDPELFRATEMTFVSLWGHVRRPGVYEVRLGTTLEKIVDAFGDGAPEGIGMLFPGGPSAPPILGSEATLPLDPDALRSAGSGLGTASVLVLPREVCALSVGLSLASFFERESCLQCPPCSVGTSSLSRILREIDKGEARASQFRALQETAGFMSVHGYCAHSRTAATVVTGLLARFPEEIERHRSGSGCAGTRLDPFSASAPERMAIEAALARRP